MDNSLCWAIVGREHDALLEFGQNTPQRSVHKERCLLLLKHVYQDWVAPTQDTLSGLAGLVIVRVVEERKIAVGRQPPSFKT